MKERKEVFESKEAEGIRIKLDQLKIDLSKNQISKKEFNAQALILLFQLEKANKVSSNPLIF